MIKIQAIGAVSETGKRQNNEDCQGYDAQLGVYLVCDGVGGVEKGEVASHMAVQTLLGLLSQQPDLDVPEAIRETEARMSEYVEAHPEASGMATTLTLTRVRSDGIEVAWIGDSRVYQFRQGRLVYRTEDHSWVNEAVKAGILTPEEAVDHPRSNIITRALQGSHKPVAADVQVIRDLEPGDFILQCSDGVLESWDDADLEALFGSIPDLQEILDTLSAECAEHSRDNYTALLYQVGQVELAAAPPLVGPDILVEAIEEPSEPLRTNALNPISSSSRDSHSSGRGPLQAGFFRRLISSKGSLLTKILVVLSILLVPLLIWLSLKLLSNPKVGEKESTGTTKDSKDRRTDETVANPRGTSAGQPIKKEGTKTDSQPSKTSTGSGSDHGGKVDTPAKGGKPRPSEKKN